MSEVLIVAKTRMQQSRVCIGAHDLADFRSLRLFRYDGSRVREEAGIDIGDVWEMNYVARADPTPPHLEDVLVQEGARKIRREANPAGVILQRDTVWRVPSDLFDGRLAFSRGGSAYVPLGGPLPTRSTGYWQPDHQLTLHYSYDKPRYRWTGGGDLDGVRYVGVADPAPVISAGSLVRLSPSHPFPPDGDQTPSTPHRRSRRTPWRFWPGRCSCETLRATSREALMASAPQTAYANSSGGHACRQRFRENSAHCAGKRERRDGPMGRTQSPRCGTP